MKNTFQLVRDPVLVANAFAAFLSLISTFFLPLTPDQQGALNAAFVLVANAVAAFRVGDGQVAMILGVFKAFVAIGVSFGLGWSQSEQFIIMTFVTAIGAMFTRTQVFAPAPPLVPPAE